jgi:hypothetical protein
MADKLNWTKTFEDANYPEIPDMIPIKYTGEREEFDHDVYTLLKKRSIIQHRFNTQKRKYAWFEHHSCCTVKHGKCKWEQCPGLSRDNLTDRNRPVLCVPYHTHHKCIQYSMQFGKAHYFFNGFSLDDTRNCHDLYHKKYHGKEIDT